MSLRYEIAEEVSDLCDEHGMAEVIDGLKSYAYNRIDDANETGDAKEIERWREAVRLLNNMPFTLHADENDDSTTQD